MKAGDRRGRIVLLEPVSVGGALGWRYRCVCGHEGQRTVRALAHDGNRIMCFRCAGLLERAGTGSFLAQWLRWGSLWSNAQDGALEEEIRDGVASLGIGYERDERWMGRAPEVDPGAVYDAAGPARAEGDLPELPLGKVREAERAARAIEEHGLFRAVPKDKDPAEHVRCQIHGVPGSTRTIMFREGDCPACLYFLRIKREPLAALVPPELVVEVGEWHEPRRIRPDGDHWICEPLAEQMPLVVETTATEV